MLIRKRSTGFMRCSITKELNVLFKLLEKKHDVLHQYIKQIKKPSISRLTHVYTLKGSNRRKNCLMFQINNPLLNNRPFSKKETPPPQFKYNQTKVTMERTLIPKFKLQKGGRLALLLWLEKVKIYAILNKPKPQQW